MVVRKLPPVRAVGQFAAALAFCAHIGMRGGWCALPPDVHAMAPDWHTLGQGEMRWFGFSLYRAALWVSGARFDPAKPFALALTYSRDIPGSRLVSTSVSEMARLGWGGQDLLDRWRGYLEKVLPDVRKGETIIGVNLPGHGVRFYHQDRELGEIADPDFARAFFSIWLDSRTRAPDLRAQLLNTP